MKRGIDSPLLPTTVLPLPHASTVSSSIATHSSALCVNSVTDDDPILSTIGRVFLPTLDKGRGTMEFDFGNDVVPEDPDDDNFCTRPFAIELNALDIHRPIFCHSSDVQSATSTTNNDDAPVTTVIPDGVSSSKIDKAPYLDGNDPDAVRAQIDSGAFTSCTDQKHMLHDYRDFSPSYPCPVTLLPASHGSDIVPKGVGFLHVPAPNAQGFITIFTFYHLSLCTNVIEKCVFLCFAGHKPKDFSGDCIQKYNDAGTFTFHASHRLRRSQDVYVHGILRHGKCYTPALISPDLDVEHPLATPSTSRAAAIASDPELAAACQRATIQAIYAHQEGDYAQIREDFATLPSSLHNIPFHEYIQKNTPVSTIQAETERLLWHQ